MKLAVTIQHYWPFVGGGENYCKAISEGLATEHEVTVYTTDLVSTSPFSYSDELTEFKNKVKIIRIPSIKPLAGIYGPKQLGTKTSPIFEALSATDTVFTWPLTIIERAFSSSIPHRLCWLTKKFKDTDLVVSFNMITGMTALSYIASTLKKKPHIVFPFYHVGLASFERPSLFKILRDANLVICSTDYEKHELIKRGLDTRKLCVLSEGVDPPIVESKAVDEISNIIHKTEDQLILMYIGRRDYNKGYPQVLSAVSRLVKSGLPVKLVITGYGETGANLAAYAFLRKNRSIIDLGVADERTKNAAMSLADAIVLPSRAETYPLAFVESWFLGKAVVGARIGSVSSMVRDGIHGLLVDFGDVAGLAAAIRFLYENPDKRIEMGKLAQIRAFKELTLGKTVANVKRIFDALKCEVAN
jgi:glycosyltransferase involved in cell wall biosynthesis